MTRLEALFTLQLYLSRQSWNIISLKLLLSIVKRLIWNLLNALEISLQHTFKWGLKLGFSSSEISPSIQMSLFLLHLKLCVIYSRIFVSDRQFPLRFIMTLLKENWYGHKNLFEMFSFSEFGNFENWFNPPLSFHYINTISIHFLYFE